jgi:hypothetical protein
MRFRRRLSQAAGLIGFLVATLGLAFEALAEAPTALVFLEEPDGPLAHRMRAELVAMGLSVDVRKEPGSAGAPLETAARDAKTVVGIRLVNNEAGVDMTILDRATGKTVHRTLSVPAGAEPPAPELVVLRTVELLRASLMELDAPHPSRGEVPAGPEVHALLPPATRRAAAGIFSAGIGPAVALAPGAAAGLDMNLTLDWFARGAFAFGAELALRTPMIGTRVSGPEGFANVSDTAIRVSALLRLGPCCTRLSADVGAGLSLDILSLDGVGTPPDTGRTVRATGASPVAEAGLRLRLFGGWYVRLEGSVGCLLPSTLINFANRDVGNWGCPLASAGAAIAFAWP